MLLRLCSLIGLVWLAACPTLAWSDDRLDFFEAKVRPLLVRHCFECHGEEKQESDLRFDSRASILQGGASGTSAVVVGDNQASPLMRYVRREEEGMEMPPDAPLSDEEVDILGKWIDEGLSWPEHAQTELVTMESRWRHDWSSHWAFQPVRVVQPRKRRLTTEWKSWSRTPIDTYVIEGLLHQSLTPSEPAPRRTLLRRLKFDLLGVPPTTEEIRSFELDTSADAYERRVDRYLASPQYGERWGRHWLDVARYADTRGYAFARDRNYPWAYTYRDYVIRSFNDDLPYDDFVVEQLAADYLELGSDNSALAGLGFLTVGRKFNNANDDIDDKIDAVTRGFVGLTVACARCHDHKYDAIPTEDYYSLYGVFASSNEPASLPLIGDEATRSRAVDYEARLNGVRNRLNAFDTEKHSQLTTHAQTRIHDYLMAAAEAERSDDLVDEILKDWQRLLRNKATDDSPTLMPWYRLGSVNPTEFPQAVSDLVRLLKDESNAKFLNPAVRAAILANPPQERRDVIAQLGVVLADAYQVWQSAGGNDAARRRQSPEVRQLLWYFSDNNSPAVIQKSQLDRYLDAEEKAERLQHLEAVQKVEATMPVVFHRAMVVADNKRPQDAHVLIRGSAGRRGDKVPRQSPRLISGPVRERYRDGSGRLELAQDVVHPDNPLTARVFVNRVWMHHFGRPLVATPSDFGIRCPEPVHRELLDYLANRFVENGWSIKSLHREIMLSAVYQQASANRADCLPVDPENELLWKMNRHRLEFESMRDSILFVSGELDLEFGGKSVRMFRKADGGRRRSIYGYVDRQDLPNLLRVFDFAGPDQSVAQRAETTVPQQALFLMNSPFLTLHANAIATRVREEADVVTAMFERVLARAPSMREREVALRFLADAKHDGAAMPPLARLAQVLLLTNEFYYVD